MVSRLPPKTHPTGEGGTAHVKSGHFCSFSEVCGLRFPLTTAAHTGLQGAAHPRFWKHERGLYMAT